MSKYITNDISEIEVVKISMNLLSFSVISSRLPCLKSFLALSLSPEQVSIIEGLKFQKTRT